MTFEEKHQPRSISDLVFHDPGVAQIISEYAAGKRHKNLLLYGPPGSVRWSRLLGQFGG